jgi:triacylglycerol lipase
MWHPDRGSIDRSVPLRLVIADTEGPSPVPVLPVRACAALGVDAAVLSVRLAGYPLGVRARRPGNQLADGSVPVVLVHGIVDNRSAFAVLQRSLRRHGFGHVTAINYPILTADVRTAAHRLAEHVERVCQETGADRVHLVGHSLGGIVARWYVQRAGGDARAATVVTLGSPHAGTHAARLVPLPVVRQLRPGSAVLRDLAAPAPGCRTRFVSVWSEQDEMVLPRRAAALEHPDLDVTDVKLRGVGHLALTSHPRAIAAVTAALLSGSPVPQGFQSFSKGA